MDSPIITKEDLLEFHRIHIGNVANNHPLVAPEPETESSIQYYSDGRVRMLTDEQIEYFRAVELWKLEKIQGEKTASQSVDKVSVAESPPGIAISNSLVNYRAIFGDDEVKMIQLDISEDKFFNETCKRQKVRDYYPVLPLKL